jgi:hypothetical protein
MIADDIAPVAALADAVRRTGARTADAGAQHHDVPYVPPDLRSTLHEPAIERHLDALNRELLDRLQRGGQLFVSNAVIGGRYALRACIVNFHTTRADVAAVPEIVVRVGRDVDADLRATTSEPR